MPSFYSRRSWGAASSILRWFWKACLWKACIVLSDQDLISDGQNTNTPYLKSSYKGIKLCWLSRKPVEKRQIVGDCKQLRPSDVTQWESKPAMQRKSGNEYRIFVSVKFFAPPYSSAPNQRKCIGRHGYVGKWSCAAVESGQFVLDVTISWVSTPFQHVSSNNNHVIFQLEQVENIKTFIWALKTNLKYQRSPLLIRSDKHLKNNYYYQYGPNGLQNHSCSPLPNRSASQSTDASEERIIRTVTRHAHVRPRQTKLVRKTGLVWRGRERRKSKQRMNVVWSLTELRS